MKFTIHQVAALAWVVVMPLLKFTDEATITNPAYLTQAVLIIIVMTAVILGMPWMMNRFPPMRARHCWTDGFTPEQHAAWIHLRIFEFRRLAKVDATLPDRVNPYLRRMCIFGFAMGTLMFFAPLLVPLSPERTMLAAFFAVVTNVSVLYTGGACFVLSATLLYGAKK